MEPHMAQDTKSQTGHVTFHVTFYVSICVFHVNTMCLPCEHVNTFAFSRAAELLEAPSE